MTPSPQWWSTCPGITIKSSPTSTASLTSSVRRCRVTRGMWTTAIPVTTLTLSSLKWRKYVNNHAMCQLCGSQWSRHSSLCPLDRTKGLTWASLRPTWHSALWICSWLEQRRHPRLCCGPWFSSSSTLTFRVGACSARQMLTVKHQGSKTKAALWGFPAYSVASMQTINPYKRIHSWSLNPCLCCLWSNIKEAKSGGSRNHFRQQPDLFNSLKFRGKLCCFFCFVFLFLEKVQAEIDQVIGQTRLPTMADRCRLPYTDAVLHEIERMGNIVPLNGLRMAAKDTMLGGYLIPKV